MSKPVVVALRRDCPDCGKTMYGYPTQKRRMLWHCRDTGEQIGCNARMTSGPMHSAQFIEQYDVAKLAAQPEQVEDGPEKPEREQRNASGGDDAGASEPAGEREREQFVNPVTG